MADPTTISVVIPAFNAAGTIGRALESVLAQTLAPLEVIVIDDGSSDETAALAEAFGDPVRVIRKENGGTASARNRGIAEARGELVAFLDADDRYEPERLASIDAKLVEDPTLDGVLTDAILIWPDKIQRSRDWWPAAARRDRLDLRAKIIFCAVTIRKRVLDEVGPFDSRYRLLEDVEMWYRLICRGYAIGFVEEPSYVYMINFEGKTQSAGGDRGEGELFRIQVQYALARRTPHRWRPRLVARGLRHGKRALRARLAL